MHASMPRALRRVKISTGVPSGVWPNGARLMVESLAGDIMTQFTRTPGSSPDDDGLNIAQNKVARSVKKWKCDPNSYRLTNYCHGKNHSAFHSHYADCRIKHFCPIPRRDAG